MFRWEPEGRYRCTKSMTIAPFWFLLKDVRLRTRRALSLYKIYDNNALLVLNGTSPRSINALLALSRRIALKVHYVWSLVKKRWCAPSSSPLITWVGDSVRGSDLSPSPSRLSIHERNRFQVTNDYSREIWHKSSPASTHQKIVKVGSFYPLRLHEFLE